LHQPCSAAPRTRVRDCCLIARDTHLSVQYRLGPLRLNHKKARRSSVRAVSPWAFTTEAQESATFICPCSIALGLYDWKTRKCDAHLSVQYRIGSLRLENKKARRSFVRAGSYWALTTASQEIIVTTLRSTGLCASRQSFSVVLLFVFSFFSLSSHYVRPDFGLGGNEFLGCPVVFLPHSSTRLLVV
jgi:hypothetical protein